MSKRTCEHIQADGLRCFNPAMYRRQVCYHHWRLLRPSAPVCDPAYVPPVFDCEASVSLTTAHILRCLLAGKIDVRKAQAAMTCVRETAKSLRLQGKVGDHIETSFTAFMADYFSALDEIQTKSAATYPDPQPLIYPAHFADLPDEDEFDDVSSRAPVVRGEGSASSAGEQSASTSNDVDNVDTGFQARVPRVQLATSTTTNNPTHHNSPDNRGRAGLQPRVAYPEKPRALAPVDAPISAEPQVGEHHNSPDNRGRAGLQPRVADPENSGALAPVAPPKKPPLSATQLKLMKKILRRGPSHPRFPEATRLLDHHIATNSA